MILLASEKEKDMAYTVVQASVHGIHIWLSTSIESQFSMFTI